ncbi:MAG: sulfite exporter TauE/SafE family protein [Spirochaetaceae bacterium]|nr:MAG: sulfite exporter TauE/SafE family protein [Spirochaetaceae bacterium]
MLTLTLPLSGIEVWIPGVVLLGILIGFLIGLFGVGGGFLLTPLLKVVFGIPYPVAVGSSLVQIFINSCIATYRHWRNQKVDFKLGLILAAGALVGTEIGVRILTRLQRGAPVLINNRPFPPVDLVLNILFLVLLSGVAIFILLETARSTTSQEVNTAVSRWLRTVRLRPMLVFPRSEITSFSFWIPILLAVFVGVLTGLMGVGGGFVNFPLLIYVIGVPTHIAVGTSVFQVLLASGYGGARHLFLGNVEIILVTILFVGSFAGVQIGVKVSQVLGGRRIRRYFALVVAQGVALVIWDLIRQIFF